MSERRQLAVLAGLSVGTLTCFGGLLLCPHRAQCLAALIRVDTWVAAGTRIVLPLAAASLALGLARLVWVLARAGLRTRALPEAGDLPPDLIAAMTRTGVSRVRCLAGEAPTAFCAGAFRPRVLVSEGLVGRLGADELDAVLLHEREHVRNFEPLVRAAHDSASEVFFYVPLVRWWSRHRLEDAELRADRAALDRLGPRPVAAALWALGRSTVTQGAAAFGGVAELRVAQVLGDPLPARAPGWPLVAISGMGGYLAFQVASCLVQAAQRLI
ncbi:MAG TPA: M56 family metallopeptidase [Candidatus Acidoferrales bacterium]|nr:M56 family metallopeptidase [Candidatus Acidoferrales bacterium]